MKLKIKVKELTEGCMPVITAKGDWCDLKAAETIEIKAAQAGVQYQKDNNKYRDVFTETVYIPLGVAMKLPDGFEAIVASRSSSPNKFKVFIPNGIGIIDNTYKGNNDQWYYVAAPMNNTIIERGTRICQFRIQLSQKATMWQKIKWFFSSGIEFVKVDNLDDVSRGGLGSTGY